MSDAEPRAIFGSNPPGENTEFSSASDEVRTLVQRARAGDVAAAEQLVALYEPQIRREARARLKKTGMRSLVDSADVSQSVFRTFFARGLTAERASGSRAHLAEFFRLMVHGKIVDKWRTLTAEKRDVRRTQQGSEVLRERPAQQALPSKIAEVRELRERLLSRMNSEDRWIAEQRLAGASWAEIAETMHDTAEAVRARFARATKKACLRLVSEPDPGA